MRSPLSMNDYEFSNEKKKDDNVSITHISELSDDELHMISSRIHKIITLMLIIFAFTGIVLLARRFNTCLEDIESMKSSISSMQESITEIQDTLDNFDETLSNINKTIDEFDERVSKLESIHNIDSTSE